MGKYTANGNEITFTKEAGKFGVGARFDGSKHPHVIVDGFRNYDWSNGVSVCAWVHRNGLPGNYMTIATTMTGGAGPWKFYMGREGCATGSCEKIISSFNCAWGNCGDGEKLDILSSPSATASIPLKQWTHLCMTGDSNYGRLYVNGKLSKSHKMFLTGGWVKKD